MSESNIKSIQRSGYAEKLKNYSLMDELFKEGAESRAEEMAITMIQDGEPNARNIRYTKLTKSQVEKLGEKTRETVMA